MKKIILKLLCFFITFACITSKGYAQSACACNCLKPLFDYLISSDRLFIAESQKVKVSSLIAAANAAGYNVSVNDCSILDKNKDGYFYAVTTSSSTSLYKARIGDCFVGIKPSANTTLDFKKLISDECDNAGTVVYRRIARNHRVFRATRSMNYTFTTAGFGGVDTTSQYLKVAFSSANSKAGYYGTSALVAMDDIAAAIPDGGIIMDAYLHFFSYPGGHDARHPHASSTRAEVGYRSVGKIYTTNAWTYASVIANKNPPGAGSNDGLSFGTDEPFPDFMFDMYRWSVYSNTEYDNGFLLGGITYNKSYTGDSALLYATVCSSRYPDSTKRPYINLAWFDSKDTAVVAKLFIDSCYSCAGLGANSCYSAITDTSVNPYLYGITGNLRPSRAFTYYGPRVENDPASQTNIRKDGTLSNFSNFWQLKDSVWVPQDTAVSKWVWNSESTLFNEKGAEMENKDPLGRYNAGLYGYGNALATAVANNARFREIAFEGFEDYNFAYGACITCKPSRNFDFTSYQSNFDSTEQHSGKYSLRVNAGMSAGITAVVAADNDKFNLGINTAANNCKPTGDRVLKSIRAGSDALLPAFSPIAGKQMLVSVWVKEAGQCNDTTYTGNKVSIILKRTGEADMAITAQPKGNIIEGWQRYEMVVTVPEDASTFMISLQNTGNNIVYFDDLRVHPYNANMKSYVYDEVSLRLMAELDENNYATFYEYDDDGSLVRVKKETERGIMTIKESRNGLIIE